MSHPPSGAPLIGREGDVARVRELLATPGVVTLTGPVGVGKSALATEVAPAARRLDLTGAGPSTVGDEFSHALAGGHALVVVEVTARQVGLVREALARVQSAHTVLVVCRSPLGIAGERVHAVHGLDAAAIAQLLRQPTGAAAIDSIQQATAGLPLAIEELAGWAGTLALGELAERATDLLAQPGGRFGVVVAAALADLDPADRHCLAMLAVFEGAFTLDEAQAVTALDPSDLLPAIRRLVDDAWLLAEVTEGQTAYAVPAPFRRLAGDIDGPARARHLECFAALAARSERDLAGPGRTECVRHLTRCSDDVDAALRWSAGADALAGLRMAASLWLWWLSCSRLAEGRAWIAQLRDAVADLPADVSARAACAAAVLAVEGGDYDEAAEQATHALDGFAALGDADGSARAATVLGSASRYLGHYDVALRHYETALAFRRELGDEHGLAAALNNIALLARDVGDLATARERFEESLVLKRRLRETRSAAIGLANLSDVLIRGGRYAQAQDALFEAAMIATDLGDDQLIATIACNQGDAALGEGDHAGAIEHFGRALAAYRCSGGAHDVVPALCSLAGALEGAGRSSEAVARLREAEAQSSANDNPAQLAEIRAALARLGHAAPLRQPGGLTPRQTEILRLVAGGTSNKRLATELQISVATVERHLATIYQKLGVASRVEATRFAIDNGLVSSRRGESTRGAADYSATPRAVAQRVKVTDVEAE